MRVFHMSIKKHNALATLFEYRLSHDTKVNRMSFLYVFAAYGQHLL